MKGKIYMTQEKNVKPNHNMILENRKSLSISGVTDVDSFDEKEVCLYTQLGELTIKGKELHIDSMSVETGDMTITGDIWSIVYGDKDRQSPLSALGRLFR
jgi:sporulation protein YabP